MFLFHFQDPIRTPHCIWWPCLLSLQLVSFSIFPLAFHDLDLLKNTGQLFYRISLHLALPGVFSWETGIGENATEVRCPYCITSGVHGVTMIYHWRCWPWSFGFLLSARFLTVKLSFYHTHLKVNHQVQPTLKGREIKLHLLARGDIYIYYLELFGKKDVYLVSHLFIQSFVYICMTHGHCLLWAIISYTCYVFSCSNCSSFDHWELLQIGS